MHARIAFEHLNSCLRRALKTNRSFFCLCRGSPEGRKQRVSALSGRSVAQRDDRDRVHNAAQGPVHGGGVQTCEERATNHQPEPELHGAIVGAGTGFEGVRRCGCRAGGTEGLPPVSLVSSEQRGGHFRLQRLSRARSPGNDYERGLFRSCHWIRVPAENRRKQKTEEKEKERADARFAMPSRRFASQRTKVERHTLHISYVYIR